MPAFLVTGNPGSGKSALARELGRRGLQAIDPDDDPELAYSEDAAGHRAWRSRRAQTRNGFDHTAGYGADPG